MSLCKNLLFNNKEDIGSNPFGHVKSVHSLSAKNIFIVNFYEGIVQWLVYRPPRPRMTVRARLPSHYY